MRLLLLNSSVCVSPKVFSTWLLAWSAQRPLVAHRVNRRTAGYKHYMHPVVGELRLDCDTWDSPEGGGQRLMVLTADPGTPSHDRLRVLASWAVTAHAVVGNRNWPADGLSDELLLEELGNRSHGVSAA